MKYTLTVFRLCYNLLQFCVTNTDEGGMSVTSTPFYSAHYLPFFEINFSGLNPLPIFLSPRSEGNNNIHDCQYVH